MSGQYPHAWGAPHPAIDPETFGRAPRTDLGNAIALYAKEDKDRKAREKREARQQRVEKKQAASHQEALAAAAGERFRQRDLLLPKIRIAHAAARKDPDSGPLPI